MKALTVCQPYADLLLLPRSHPHHKRTENRTWYDRFRGPLLIHAGKSKDWWQEDEEHPGHDSFGLNIAGFVLGAIVGVVDVIDWLPAEQVEARYRQLLGHQHIEGPFCCVVCNVRRFVEPVPYRGRQKLFDVPLALVAAQMAKLETRAAS